MKSTTFSARSGAGATATTKSRKANRDLVISWDLVDFSSTSSHLRDRHPRKERLDVGANHDTCIAGLGVRSATRYSKRHDFVEAPFLHQSDGHSAQQAISRT